MTELTLMHPTRTLGVRETFGLDTDMQVPGSGVSDEAWKARRKASTANSAQRRRARSPARCRTPNRCRSKSIPTIMLSSNSAA